MKLFNRYLQGVALLLVTQSVLQGMEKIEMVSPDETASQDESANKKAVSEIPTQTYMIDVVDFMSYGNKEIVGVYAVKKNDVKLLNFLVGKIDFEGVKLADFEENLLHVAARNDSAEAADFLINQEVAKDWAGHSCMSTPVSTAVKCRNLRTLLVLLKKGADANYRTSYCHRPPYHTPFLLVLDDFLSTPISDENKKQDQIDKQIMIALVENMALEDLKTYQENFEKKIAGEEMSDSQVFDGYATEELFKNPPVNTYLALLPVDLRAFAQLFCSMLLKEKVRDVASLINEVLARRATNLP